MVTERADGGERRGLEVADGEEAVTVALSTASGELSALRREYSDRDKFDQPATATGTVSAVAGSVSSRVGLSGMRVLVLDDGSDVAVRDQAQVEGVCNDGERTDA